MAQAVKFASDICANAINVARVALEDNGATNGHTSR